MQKLSSQRSRRNAAEFAENTLARSAASAGIAWFESTVTETLTSEVETTSTATLWRSKASKIARKKPWASNMRGAATSTIVMRFFAAMALKMFLPWGARVVMRVPSQDGLREFNTYTGMFFWIAG